jgi:hypothetical protein
MFNDYEKKKKSSINKIDPSTCQILNYLCCCCGKKTRKEINFLDECEKIMGNYLDYLSIIKFLKEFNRLKKILFSDSQLKVFSYLPKPNISYKNNKLKMDSLYNDIFEDDKNNQYKKKGNNKNNHVQYSKIFSSYISLMGKEFQCGSLKRINKRLISYMDKDMKKCFEGVVNNYLEQVTQ